MKVIIVSRGGESVGIFPSDATVELDTLFVTDNEGMREIVRSILSSAFGELFDDRVAVWFDDECPDCGSITTLHKACCPSRPEAETTQFGE